MAERILTARNDRCRPIRTGSWDDRMRVSRRVVVQSVVLIALTILVGYAPAASAAGSRSQLRALALNLSDLPKGTTLDSIAFWTNRQAAAWDHVPVALYDAHGRILSCRTVFSNLHKSSAGAMGGVVGVDGLLTEFRSVAEATWFYRWYSKHVQKTPVLGSTAMGTQHGTAASPFRYKLARSPHIGDASTSMSVTWPAEELAYQGRVVIFRQGQFVDLVHVYGILGRVPAAIPNELGRRVD